VRVIDCECGHTLHAANDEELSRILRRHFADRHDAELSEDSAREMVSERAYSASDS
jgi:predicted small metal-binding protein